MSYPSMSSCSAGDHAPGGCKEEQGTHVGEFHDGGGFELHVFALYFLPDLVDGLGSELGLVVLVGAEAANEILEGSLPHVRR